MEKEHSDKLKKYLFIGLFFGIAIQLISGSYYAVAVVVSGIFCGFVIKKFLSLRYKEIKHI